MQNVKDRGGHVLHFAFYILHLPGHIPIAAGKQYIQLLSGQPSMESHCTFFP